MLPPLEEVIDMGKAFRLARSTVVDYTPEPVAVAKPRWARHATRRTAFAPEMDKPGTRRVTRDPHTCKRFASR